MNRDAHLGLVELGTVCARLRAANLDLFEVLGAWVTEATDPTEQQFLAVATHRHAWHADLWAARCPAIPPVDLDALTQAAREPAARTDDRLVWYRRRLDSLLAEARELVDRADPVLDPSTRRTVALVRPDLEELRDRAAALG